MSGIIRAARIDLVAYRQFIPFLLIIIAGIAAYMGWQGPEALAGTAAFLSVFMLMIFSLNLSAQDDANGWSAYRLALPLSRRDIVLGRYAAIGALTLAGIATPCVVAPLAWLVRSTLFGAADLGMDAAGLGTDEAIVVWGFVLVAIGIALAIGSILPGAIVPLVFRFGSERVMKFYPFMMIILIVGPTIGLQYVGGGFIEALNAAFGAIANPVTMVVAILALFGAALLIAALSAAISLRLYRTRDL